MEETKHKMKMVHLPFLLEDVGSEAPDSSAEFMLQIQPPPGGVRRAQLETAGLGVGGPTAYYYSLFLVTISLCLPSPFL